MSLPTISVVMPSYNHERYIADAIFSALGQSYTPAEVIVIDDGSSDRSADVIRAMAAGRPNLIVSAHRNRGAHNTINAAIHRSDSDLVAILNSDDRYAPTRLERIARRFAEDPTIDVVATGLRFMDGDGLEIEYPWFEAALAYYRQTSSLAASLINGNFLMTTSNVVVRRSLFDRIGMFSDFRYTHDLDFFLRVLSTGHKIDVMDEKLVWYRIHQTNTIGEGDLKVKIEWAASIAIYLDTLGRRDGARMSSEMLLILEVVRKHTLGDLVSMFLCKLASGGRGCAPMSDFRQDTAFWAAVETIAA